MQPRDHPLFHLLFLLQNCMVGLGRARSDCPFTLLHWFDGKMSRCRPRSLGLSGLIHLISLLALALGIVGSEMIAIKSQIHNLSSASRRGKPLQICGNRKFKIEILTTLFSGPVNPVKWPCCRPRRLGLSMSALTQCSSRHQYRLLAQFKSQCGLDRFGNAAVGVLFPFPVCVATEVTLPESRADCLNIPICAEIAFRDSYLAQFKRRSRDNRECKRLYFVVSLSSLSSLPPTPRLQAAVSP
jgi:hypothetical protein